MRKAFMIMLLLGLLAFTACGGSSDNEPTTDSTENSSNESASEDTSEEVEETAEEIEEEETAEEAEETVEEEAVEEVVEEEVEVEEAEETVEEEAVEEVVEEESSGGFGGLLMSGTDPDTGLEINPESITPGDTYIVRGIIISMNLTPVTSPEFLIETPDGNKFRIRTQPLEDTFFIDDTQWQPYEYQLGVGAQATVTLDASASLSDVAISEDLTLIMVDE